MEHDAETIADLREQLEITRLAAEAGLEALEAAWHLVRNSSPIPRAEKTMKALETLRAAVASRDEEPQPSIEVPPEAVAHYAAEQILTDEQLDDLNECRIVNREGYVQLWEDKFDRMMRELLRRRAIERLQKEKT